MLLLLLMMVLLLLLLLVMVQLLLLLWLLRLMMWLWLLLVMKWLDWEWMISLLLELLHLRLELFGSVLMDIDVVRHVVDAGLERGVKDGVVNNHATVESQFWW